MTQNDILAGIFAGMGEAIFWAFVVFAVVFIIRSIMEE